MTARKNPHSNCLLNPTPVFKVPGTWSRGKGGFEAECHRAAARAFAESRAAAAGAAGSRAAAASFAGSKVAEGSFAGCKAAGGAELAGSRRLEVAEDRRPGVPGRRAPG